MALRPVATGLQMLGRAAPPARTLCGSTLSQSQFGQGSRAMSYQAGVASESAAEAGEDKDTLLINTVEELSFVDEMPSPLGDER